MVVKLSDVVEIERPRGELQEVVVRFAAKDVPATFFDCFSDADAPAIRSGTPGQPALSHRALRDFMAHGEGRLSSRGIMFKDVVAILVPNGPELATVLLTCACQSVAAPLDYATPEAELVAAFDLLGVKHVIAFQLHDSGPPPPVVRAAAESGCELHAIRAAAAGSAAGVFEWVSPAAAAAASFPVPEALRWVPAEDAALLLRTSGTTSKPKVVPISPRGLYLGARCMGHGLELTPEDSTVNVMPLTHIGGISCSLMATLVTGGSVVCAAGFDPAQFVGWLEELRPTWYYAVPTIHKAVALFAKGLLPRRVRHCLRVLRTGAANLPDADARELRDVFQCAVLPTYSMSECMPIAQPPLDYKLDRPGSVGLPIASSLRIAGPSGEALPFGESGDVCIRGPVVTAGYRNNEAANAACFFGEKDEEGFRWFCTGDVGYIDRDGYLFLTGRSKELIKRGGEQVSPYEVEDVLLQHPAVAIALVFGVPNDFWGEEVAAAVVLRPELGLAPCDAEAVLRRHVAGQLADSRVPRQIVVVESSDKLPKTSTGKYIRAGCPAHLGLKAVDTRAPQLVAGAAARFPIFADRSPAMAHGDPGGLAGPPAKPHRAIYGIRYMFAVYVTFVHVGPDSPTWLGTWKSYSAAMPGFFMLAGFLLSSSCTRPVENKRQFYRNRLIAAHPLYLLAVLYALPLTFIICPYGSVFSSALQPDCANLGQGLPGQSAAPGGYIGVLIYGYAMALLGQLAWPWGVPVLDNAGFFDPVLWFSSAYYFCIFCFPFLHNWTHSRCLTGRRPREHCCRPYCIWYCCWPWATLSIAITIGVAVLCTAIAVVLTAITDKFEDPLRQRLYGGGSRAPEHAMQAGWDAIRQGEPRHPGSGSQGLNGFAAYSCPVTWALIFFMGMLTNKLFVLNRSGPHVSLWPHWGKLTDTLTILVAVACAAGSAMWAGAPEHDAQGNPSGLAIIVADVWAFPGRLYLTLLCVWIYGLACGEGLTARLMGTRFLASYLSPASYSVYLFHWPTYKYWCVVKVKAFHLWGPPEEADEWWFAWVDYLVVLVLSTGIALVACHKLNAPLTALFMRAVDAACGLCCQSPQSVANEEAGTLEKLVEAIRGLSGAEVTAGTPIAQCGLDSFGTSALLGFIRPKFPGLTLTALEVYRLHSVGDLAARIEAEVGAGAAKALADPACV